MIPAFLAPGLLLGSLAISVPVALHFLYKPRYRPQPWAAMTFLRLSLRQTTKRIKFREWILLALRCLLLILLALALARPTGSVVLGGRGEGVDAVLVFDTSFSMGTREGDRTRFGRAKDSALQIIDNLPSQSTVQVVTLSNRVETIGPRSPGNLDEARKLVERLELTSLAGDLEPGFAEASAAIERTTGPNKEVYFLTDLQRSGIAPRAAAIRAAAEALKSRATVLFVECADASRPVTNVALESLTVPDGVPHTGSRLPVTVLLKNTGSVAARNLTVTLQLDGNADSQESITVDEVPPGQSLPVTLTARLELPGNRVLTAEVRADDLPGDNRLDRVISVRDALRVLVVDGRVDPADPKRSASHFVVNALAPVPPDRLRDHHVQLTVVDSIAAVPGLLAVNDVCVLCDVRLPADAAAGELATRLTRFAEAGGTLVFAPGEQLEVARVNNLLGSGGAKLLPYDYEKMLDVSAESPGRFAPDGASEAGFLARYRQEPYRAATASAEVAFGYKMMTPGGTPPTTLLSLASGEPAIGSRRVGPGEVVQLALPLDATGGSWPAKAGSYLTFAQLLLAHVAGRGAEPFNRVAGQPITWTDPPVADGYDAVLPNGSRIPLGGVTGGVTSERSVTLARTDLAGITRLTPRGIDPPVGPVYAVAYDARESEDLDRLEASDLEELLGFRPTILKAGDSGGTTDYTTERSRREWTVWLLLAVLAASGLEMAWAWHCGRAV